MGRYHHCCRTCSNGICTTSGGGEYSEVFESFVPEFFAGAKVVLIKLDGQLCASEVTSFAYPCAFFLVAKMIIFRICQD
jgi:hypothetical protein